MIEYKTKTLTGNFYLKRTWFNKFIVMVEFKIYDDGMEYTRYQRATDEDLLNLNIVCV